jgi:hypothetical protein
MSAFKTVTISAKRYLAMIDDLRKLRALEAAGVDNWEGYDDAIGSLHDGDEED